MCGKCSTKRRFCQWGISHTTFKGYRPTAGLSSAVLDEREELNKPDKGHEEEREKSPSGVNMPERQYKKPVTLAKKEPVSTTSLLIDHQVTSSASLWLDLSTEDSTCGDSLSDHLSRRPGFHASDAYIVSSPTANPIMLSHEETVLVHHYAEHLGRWLDCTNPSRQFSLRIPVLVKYCPILLRAVLAFAARHRQDIKFADLAYQRCIELLIERLSSKNFMYDDSLLCAIIILRFYEQLTVSDTGSDSEQHLSGTSAILRVLQGHAVDFSAPTFCDAAFWVYVRQCLYTATVNQQPPNINFDLQFCPIPPPPDGSNSVADTISETAWANKMTWICATVLHFAFDGVEQEPASRIREYQSLRDAVDAWRVERPSTFDPIWPGPAGGISAFPEIWFAADWHVVAFGLYHFSCIVLITHKPGPKFHLRNLGDGLTESDQRILEHARAICGSCKRSPATVPNLITLCHTIFIWGTLMSNPAERSEVLEMLANLESTEVWPTAWIINALRKQWKIKAL